jgi:hypothetical protein
MVEAKIFILFFSLLRDFCLRGEKEWSQSFTRQEDTVVKLTQLNELGVFLA